MMKHVLKKMKFSITIVIFTINFPLIIYATPALFPLITEEFTTQRQIANKTPDIMGFGLLMDVEEVDNRNTELLKDGYKIKHNENIIRSISDADRNVVSYKYGRITTMVYKNHDFIILNYTSRLLGSRVQSIYRILNFEEQVDFNDLEQNIFDKFGSRTYQTNVKSHKNYRYFFHDEEKTSQTFDCRQASSTMPKSFHPYIFMINKARVNRYSSCLGGIEVNAYYGTTKNLSKQITMFAWDSELVFENLKTQDEFLSQALQKIINSKTGVKAPKL